MADRYLIDTGVAVRWYIPQDGFEDALNYQLAHIEGDVELATVDVVRFELGDVLRKKGLLPKRISADDYVAAARSLDDLHVTVHITTADMLERAADLAARRMMSFNDALIVAWSAELDMPILTTDKRLCSAATGITRTRMLLGVVP